MKNLKTFEKYFTIEKEPLINKVVKDENGWVVVRMDMSKAMNVDFEAKFENLWSPKHIDAQYYAVEVGDQNGLEELRIFLNTYLGKANYSIVEEYFYEMEEVTSESLVDEDEFNNGEEEFEGVDAELLDDLKANFRSWEQDCNNQECFDKLTALMSERHPNLEPDTIAETCANWIGFSLNGEVLEKINEAVTDEDLLALHNQVKGTVATLKDASKEIASYNKGKKSGSLSYKTGKRVEYDINSAIELLEISMDSIKRLEKIVKEAK